MIFNRGGSLYFEKPFKITVNPKDIQTESDSNLKGQKTDGTPKDYYPEMV